MATEETMLSIGSSTTEMTIDLTGTNQSGVALPSEFVFKNKKLQLNQSKLVLDYHPFLLGRLVHFHQKEALSNGGSLYGYLDEFSDLVLMLAIER